MDAFRSADEVLLSGVQGITNLITTPGLINLDFADVKSVMSGAGSALMGIGSSRGEGRAVQAAGKAINSPLLEASMDGAQGVLLSIAGGSDLGLFEINEAASLVQEAAHPEANIIFGTVIDDSLGDEVRVTVIAAGFESGGPTHKKLEPPAYGSRAAGVIAPGVSGSTSNSGSPSGTGYGSGNLNGHGAGQKVGQGAGRSAGAGGEDRAQGYGGAPTQESAASGHGGTGGYGSDGGHAGSEQAGARPTAARATTAACPPRTATAARRASRKATAARQASRKATGTRGRRPDRRRTGTEPARAPPPTSRTPSRPAHCPRPPRRRPTRRPLRGPPTRGTRRARRSSGPRSTPRPARTPRTRRVGSPAADLDDEVDVPPFMKR